MEKTVATRAFLLLPVERTEGRRRQVTGGEARAVSPQAVPSGLRISERLLRPQGLDEGGGGPEQLLGSPAGQEDPAYPSRELGGFMEEGSRLLGPPLF